MKRLGFSPETEAAGSSEEDARFTWGPSCFRLGPGQGMEAPWIKGDIEQSSSSGHVRSSLEVPIVLGFGVELSRKRGNRTWFKCLIRIQIHSNF